MDCNKCFRYPLGFDPQQLKKNNQHLLLKEQSPSVFKQDHWMGFLGFLVTFGAFGCFWNGCWSGCWCLSRTSRWKSRAKTAVLKSCAIDGHRALNLQTPWLRRWTTSERSIATSSERNAKCWRPKPTSTKHHTASGMTALLANGNRNALLQRSSDAMWNSISWKLKLRSEAFMWNITSWNLPTWNSFVGTLEPRNWNLSLWNPSLGARELWNFSLPWNPSKKGEPFLELSFASFSFHHSRPAKPLPHLTKPELSANSSGCSARKRSK